MTIFIVILKSAYRFMELTGFFSQSFLILSLKGSAMAPVIVSEQLS